TPVEPLLDEGDGQQDHHQHHRGRARVPDLGLFEAGLVDVLDDEHVRGAGPPPLSDWIIANSFIAPIVPSRITRNEVGRSNSHVMRRNRVTGPAPSSEAASR